MMLARTSAPEEARPGFGPAALIALARARWPIVFAIVVATTLCAFAYSQFVLAREPVYKAAATVDIQPSAAQLEFGAAFAKGHPL